MPAPAVPIPSPDTIRSVTMAATVASVPLGSVIGAFTIYTLNQIRQQLTLHRDQDGQRYKSQLYVSSTMPVVLGGMLSVVLLLANAVVGSLVLVRDYTPPDQWIILSLAILWFSVTAVGVPLLYNVVLETRYALMIGGFQPLLARMLLRVPNIGYLNLVVALLLAAVGAALLLTSGMKYAGVYFLVILLPSLAAGVLSYGLYLFTGYRSVWRRYFVERAKKERAGLGLLISQQGRVLLNHQKRTPWVDSWAILGGYLNPEKGDRDCRDTANRRCKYFTQTECVARGLLARTKDDIFYRAEILSWAHAPTKDDVYEILRADGNRFNETEIPALVRAAEEEDSPDDEMQWWSLDQVQGSPLIPPHFREIAGYFLSEPQHRRHWRLRYWIPVEQPHGEVTQNDLWPE